MTSKLTTLSTILLFAWLSAAAVAEPRIELELATQSGLPPTGAHRWMQSLQGLKVDRLRIRQAHAGDRPEVQTLGSGDSATHRVTGVITARDVLLLPGGSFRRGETGKLAAWLARLKSGDDPSQPAARVAFGLSPEELVELHSQLATPIAFSTKGQNAREVARQIAARLPLPVTSDPAAGRLLQDDFALKEEMQGLSQGTALAAALRPLGLVFAPRKSAGKTQLHVSPSTATTESWPVGWPAQNPPGALAPDLFKFLPVEIADVTLAEGLAAIEGRVGVPLLFDHNSLARKGIDIRQVKVSHPAARTFYKKIIDRLLAQARLTSELRADEAGSPFLWISPVGK